MRIIDTVFMYDDAIIEVKRGFCNEYYNIYLKPNFFKFQGSNALEIAVKLEELCMEYSEDKFHDFKALIPIIKDFLKYIKRNDDFTIELNFVGFNIQTIID